MKVTVESNKKGKFPFDRFVLAMNAVTSSKSSSSYIKKLYHPTLTVVCGSKKFEFSGEHELDQAEATYARSDVTTASFCCKQHYSNIGVTCEFLFRLVFDGQSTLLSAECSSEALADTFVSSL